MNGRRQFLVSIFLIVTLLLFAAGMQKSASAAWWDKFGKPEYGGEFVQATTNLDAQFDTLSFIGLNNDLWFSVPLFESDWTLDPEIYPTGSFFVPEKYCVPYASEKWELRDPRSFVVYLRKGIKWQNKPPVNGREFTAHDIVASMKRRMGPGSMFAGMLSSWVDVIAEDDYTVVFKFKNPSGGTAFQSVKDIAHMFEAPEWVALGGPPSEAPPPTVPPKGGPPKGGPPGPGGPPKGIMGSGPLQEWKNAVGAGPWMLTDFIQGTSMTYSRNPDYFGHDPRYPENQVPYADTLKRIAIPEVSTQVAAMRTRKLDILADVKWQQVRTLEKTNPELVKGYPTKQDAPGICFRLDKKPFTDIRVRKALNMAIDRKAICQSVFGGFGSEIPSGLINQAYKGWAFEYKDWPQSLKDEYTYDPEGARQLLAEAGYPDGFKTNVVQATGFFGGTGGVELIEAFKSYFKDIGVDMEIIVMDSMAAENYYRSAKHDQMIGQGGGATWPPIRTVDKFYTRGVDGAMFQANDATYDGLRDKYMSSNTEDEAARVIQELDRYVIEQHWGVWVQAASTHYFTQPYVKGFDSRKASGMSLFKYLWVDQKLKDSMKQ